jgi:Holliday junction resolvasome RuvABC endonuclease subunit
MPIGAALRLVGSRGTLTLTSQKPIVTIESYRPQTIRQCLSWVKTGKAQGEQMFSALLPTSDIARSAVHRRLRRRAVVQSMNQSSDGNRAKWL